MILDEKNRNHRMASGLFLWTFAGIMGLLLGLTGCTKAEEADISPVTLTLAGNTDSFQSMESIITDYTSDHPNVKINYEYIQDYDQLLIKRLKNNDQIDLFVTNNITVESPLLPYALDLNKQGDKLKLSDTYEGLIHNFTVTDGSGALYAIPFGGEVRGMYVNKTLLKSLNLSVPENYAELLACCKKLKENGYVPLQGNPGYFGQMVMYPYVCSLVANAKDYEDVYQKVNNCQEGSSEVFREPVGRLYELVEKGYYNYKFVETNNQMFLDGSDDTLAMDFLNIDKAKGKRDDIGVVAFVPGTMSLKNCLDKTKEDYHSEIDYEFILSPVGDQGGYAYLSPSAGIAINKNSFNKEAALDFLNYFFSEKVNTKFAQNQNLIPNTKNALAIIKGEFDVSKERVCQLGQVTFDYVFYDVMKDTLTNVSKANNPKYMKEDGTMYSLDYYMSGLEQAIVEKQK